VTGSSFFRPCTVDVPCIVEVEHSRESLHAHVLLDGVEVGPGDTVVVHDAPAQIIFGDRLRCDRRATVLRAGRLRTWWTKFRANFELADLCEVGFSARRTR
jgi:hypothetical protein